MFRTRLAFRGPSNSLSRRTLASQHPSGPGPGPRPGQGPRPEQLRVVLLGKPGSGKGTMARLLAYQLGLVTLSTGDVLRQAVAEGNSELGRHAKAFIDAGKLVPDPLILDLVRHRLGSLASHHPADRPEDNQQQQSSDGLAHWALDGFPRTVGQASALDEMLRVIDQPINLVLNIDVPDRVILDRIAGRSIHLPSGRIYHDLFQPPKLPGLDDLTREPLVRRADDDPTVMRRRLEAFREQTQPILSYYASQSPTLIRTVSGETSAAIWPEIQRLLYAQFNVDSLRPAFASRPIQATLNDALHIDPSPAL